MKLIKYPRKFNFYNSRNIGIFIIFAVPFSVLYVLLTKNEIFSSDTFLLIAILSISIFLHNFLVIRKQQKLRSEFIQQLKKNTNSNENSQVNDDGEFIGYINGIIREKDEKINLIQEKQTTLVNNLRNIENIFINQDEQYTEFNSIFFELSEGIDNQTKSTENTSRVMEQIAVGVSQIAEKVNVTSSSTIDTGKTAGDGMRLVTDALTQMQNINNSFTVLSKIIKVFETSTKEIETIIEEISNIASQTNLLSLNARIEAARAGIEGKGFAVVANEVGKLSKQSNQFAEKISDLIKGIQLQAISATKATDVSAQDVQSGLEIVEKSARAFQEIITATEKINEQIYEISAISQEMAAGTEEVAASTEEIRNLSNHSSNLFNQVIPIIIEQFDITNKISEKIKEK